MNTDKLARRIVDRALEHAHPFGSSSDDWISDPARMDRCDAAAEDGADGSTHAEVIADMRSAVRTYYRSHMTGLKEYPYRVEAITDRYFDALEQWHEANGTLFQQIG